jgi:hypothetical protein
VDGARREYIPHLGAYMEMVEDLQRPYAVSMAIPATLEPPVAVIEATGVLGEFDYLVDFKPGSESAGALRVIYAENGMGKTTFLRAVYFLLTPDLESLQSLYELAVETVTVHLTSGARVQFERVQAEEGGFSCTVSRPDEGGEHTIEFAGDDAISRAFRRVAVRPDLSVYFQMLKSVVAPTVLVGDDRLIYSALDAPGFAPSQRTLREEREMRIRSRLHASSVRDSLDQVEKALNRTAFEGISGESSNASSGVYLDITKRILAGGGRVLATEARKALVDRAQALLKEADFEKYGLISLNQLRGIVGEFEGARANAVKFRNLYPILDPFLTNLAERVEALRPAQRLIDTFVTSVNSFLTRKQLRFSTLRGISLVGDKRGDILDPDALSSGEKHLLLLLSNAVLATFTGSLVIIDEPELSLGIRWQRSLLSELLRLTEGSDVQFLVASHSVQIMGEIDEVVSPIERDQ